MGAFQATAGVLYDFSPNNLEARGRYVEADAARRESQLRTVDAERQVASDVVAAFQAYIAASAEVAKAQEATILQAKAADGEREKFNAGQLSLIDLLAVQQRLETRRKPTSQRACDTRPLWFNFALQQERSSLPVAVGSSSRGPI